MVKHKVSELEGVQLDAAVAKAEGWRRHQWSAADWDWRAPPTADDEVEVGELMGDENWKPSTVWDHGGPIIERERIDIAYWGRKTQEPWRAGVEIAADSDVWCGDTAMKGATPLIAAMRAYVASKFGDEVELP